MFAYFGEAENSSLMEEKRRWKKKCEEKLVVI
jgi:hypothetical protein